MPEPGGARVDKKLRGYAALCVLILFLASAGCSADLPPEPPETAVHAYANAFNSKDVDAILGVYSLAALSEADTVLQSARTMERPYREAMCMEIGIEPEELEEISGREFFVAVMKAAFDKTEKMSLEVLDTHIEGTKANIKVKIIANYAKGGKKEMEAVLPVVVENGVWKLDSTGLVPGPGPKENPGE
jgi:hypothetical protein